MQQTDYNRDLRDTNTISVVDIFYLFSFQSGHSPIVYSWVAFLVTLLFAILNIQHSLPVTKHGVFIGNIHTSFVVSKIGCVTNF